MKQLGFSDVVEVAVGADICTIEEAQDFMEKVPRGAALHGDLLLPVVADDGADGCSRRNPATFP